MENWHSKASGEHELCKISKQNNVESKPFICVQG